MNLAELIEPFDYVVQRNWVQDPEHPDWDLFVSEDDYEAMSRVLEGVENIDLRHPSDGYYPEYIGSLLLKDKREWEGFKIPSPEAYFLALYYHAKVHKQENKYEAELKRAFLEWIPPVKCTDEGVGYYVNP